MLENLLCIQKYHYELLSILESVFVARETLFSCFPYSQKQQQQQQQQQQQREFGQLVYVILFTV